MKYKRVCTSVNYIEHLLILASAVSGCVSISAFASLVCTPIEITNSAWSKKKKKKHDKIVLLAKTKLNSIEVLIS